MVRFLDCEQHWRLQRAVTPSGFGLHQVRLLGNPPGSNVPRSEAPNTEDKYSRRKPVKLQRLIESIGRFRPTVKWEKESPSRFYTEFNIGELEEFYIQVDLVSAPHRFASVIFGRFDEQGRGTVKIHKSSKPVVVLSTVVGAVSDLLEKLNVEVVVFAAKEEHESFESKSSLYRRIAERIEKDKGWKVFTRTRKDLELYVLSQRELTNDEVKFVISEMGIRKKSR